ncbi:hypothetical protein CWI38_0052p0030 [Hamiltosporidium tvaerminnensis]|uniref:Tc1-like transposase DDE domain-containing protein n=1 Tax=Hamiltosporidium tvaerminnensis TaxID=1176355 RepID=A0A4Q9M4P8_9MICR|nr:hypothetical protein CWI38_0052p0030 [Hamiltosporidium tvaerminnensis]
MSNSFSGKNTNENKYDFHISKTPECIECENHLVSKCIVKTSGSHDENLPLTTIRNPRNQKVSNNDRERIIEKTLGPFYYSRRYLKTALVFVEKRDGDRRSKLTLEIKERLLARWVKRTFNVDVSTSTIDRAPRKFLFPLKRVTLVSELTRPGRGHNMRCEFAYLSVTAARSRNISVVAAMNKYGMIYHNIHERAVNDEDFKLYIKEINESIQRRGILTPIFVIDNARIHHCRGLNDDEEIASNSSGARTEPQLRILICEKFNEITEEHCSSFSVKY